MNLIVSWVLIGIIGWSTHRLFNPPKWKNK